MHAALENLSHDHRTIEGVLDVMQKAAHELLASRPVDPGLPRQCVSWLGGFLDGCHWRKEEELLFPAVAAARVFLAERPLEELRADHARVRRALGEVRASFPQMDAGHPSGGWAVAVALAACYAPLRGHMRTEEQTVFPISQQILDADKLDQMAAAFREIDAAHERSDELRELYQRVTEPVEAATPKI
jgi:hemerythrin-like domain-containing protein